VEAALAGLQGGQEQLPPVFSAKKVGGEAAHRRARRGESVELPPARVTVHEIELTRFELPLVGFRVRCSSGTYVRALARDLGEALSVGAHLIELRRTSVGGFDVADAVRMEELGDQAAVAAAAIEPLDALAHLPRLVADDAQAALLEHGRSVEGIDETLDGLVAVAHAGSLLAIGESRRGVLRPRKVFLG
jgi:tRNA pseudouridine55 synthase